MSLAKKLQKLVQNSNNTENNVVYTTLRKRVINEATVAASKGKETILIKLVGDGERYWHNELLDYLNSEKLRATTYSFSPAQVTIEISWCD